MKYVAGYDHNVVSTRASSSTTVPEASSSPSTRVDVVAAGSPSKASSG